MKLALTLIIIGGFLAALGAQAEPDNPATGSGSFIRLKSGVSVPADNFQRKDDQLMVTVTTSSGGHGQVYYYISDVAELDVAAPPALAAASDLMAKGHPDQALALISPIVAFQLTLRDIPGNWWAKSALVQASVLISLKRGPDAASLLKDIAATSQDPEIQTAAKLQLALIEPPQDPAVALSAYDAVLKQSHNVDTLTQAWIAEGDVHFSQHEFADALLAYLNVPVFYSDHNPLLPKALWGVAQSARMLKDSKQEDEALLDLTTHFPDTTEASLAQAEIMKKQNNP